MKTGDIVTYTNGLRQYTKRLTVGKEYSVVMVSTGKRYIKVQNDINRVAFYPMKYFKLVTSSSKPIGILPNGDNGALDVWSEGVLVSDPLPKGSYEPYSYRKCDMGCQAIGSTHFETCAAYDPNQSVKF